ncbi:helix-turn-helix domain-containing protein [Lactiplantibacillus songbeiensis]|uniref:Helix-turn-helix domain-containing protein n=1 Tax=Lactiplantibacillus songbeiensis TaxID=2559920 RepID=A0ABW4BXG9_9LACO|nr:helix-turn-helix transcriptional regulator [Lactiplantibacillus songbeiensis]
MNNLSIILGERLLTIGYVSEETGLSRGTISTIYHRKADSVRLDTLKKICDCLQISLSELIEYTPQAPDK